MIKTIVFDFGGVIGTAEGFEELRKIYAKLFNISVDDLKPVFLKNWFLWRVDKINEKQFWDNISTELNFNYNFEQVKEIMHNKSEPNTDVIKLTKELKNKYKIYILSNHSRELFNDDIKKFNLNELFDGIFTSYEAKIAKPKEEIYIKFLEKFNLKAEECIFIDDRQDSVEAANKLGFKGIVYKNYEQLRKCLNKYK